MGVVSTASTYDDYDYTYETDKSQDTTDTNDDSNVPPTSDGQVQEDDDDELSSNPTAIVIAVCLIILIGGAAAMFGLHYTKNLPQSFYNLFSPRWKPVNTNEQEEDEEKHRAILKKDLNETAMSEDGEGVKVDVNNMTTVTWTTDEKEDLKKEETKVDEKKEEEKEEKKDEEKESEKEKPEEKEEEPAVPTEEDPLKKDED